MAQEMIARVRQAEQAAEAVEKQAAQQAKEFLAGARAEAALREDRLTDETRRQCGERLRESQQKAGAMLDEAEREARRGADQLRRAAKAREKEAVAAILQKLA